MICVFNKFLSFDAAIAIKSHYFVMKSIDNDTSKELNSGLKDISASFPAEFWNQLNTIWKNKLVWIIYPPHPFLHVEALGKECGFIWREVI